MTAPFLSRYPHQTPADRMAPLIEWLARNPNAAIPALVEGLARIKGKHATIQVARQITVAAENVRTK